MGPAGIAASQDGTIWFTQENVGNIASITNSGVITQGTIVRGSGPAGITVADNGDPWYTMRPVDKIATLALAVGHENPNKTRCELREARAAAL